MLIGLPVLSFVFFILFYRNKFTFIGWRAGYVLAAVTLGIFSVAFIEIASLFSAVTSFFAACFWLSMLIISMGLFWGSDPKRLLKKFPLSRTLPTEWEGISGIEYACGAGIVLILAVNALVAFSFPPNNWDSMTYHLPRVMHWAVNRGVHFYPTAIDRQLFYSPGAEFSLLHCFLLTGNDRWFNFLQWSSYAGCIICASLIAQELGAAARGQILAAFFVTTIPMAVLQSTSTQNDLYISFWIAAFVALTLILQKRFSRFVFCAAAAALGLSVLTKGTFFVALPFAVYFFITLKKKRFTYILACLGIVLVLVAGHYVRSWAWQGGHSFINNDQSGLMIKRHDPAAIVVNGMAQIASEFMLPWQGINHSIEGFVQQGAAFLGVNVKAPDMFGQVFAAPIFANLVFDEDYASNPVHILLIFAVLFLFWKLRPKRELRVYLSCVLISCFLFSLFIAWQPFVTRLHLPLLVLFAPLAGVLIGPRSKGLVKLITILLFITACLSIFYHQSRPLRAINDAQHYPREVFYFMKKPPDYGAYAQAAQIIRSSGCLNVGILESADSWEYPLWAMTGYGKVQFHSLDLNSTDGFSPCMIVTVDYPENQSIIMRRKNFGLIGQGQPLQIYVQERLK